MHADSPNTLPTLVSLQPMYSCRSKKLIGCREQPQRPMRALRIHNENSVPAPASDKTIHQRNKSTPALSSLAQSGAIKAAAKRTAFADVSNTTRNTHLAKDDSVVAAKGALASKKDAVLAPIQETSKPAAILRPAQRPISSIVQKPVASDSLAPKQSAAEVAPHPIPIKKIASKRTTTVFKESTAPVEAEPVRRRERSNTAPQLSPPSEKLSRIERVVEEVLEENVEFSREESTTSLETAIAAEECHYIAGPGAVLTEEEALPTTEEHSDVPEEEEDVEHDKHDVKAHEIAPAEAERFEEYWDEEDEEYYEGDGYTGYTTRSLRQRTDNTTNGVTVVLAPRVTARTRRELEEAAIYVDAIKSPEDVEDEAWDTSMVAEYGDEIFDYMHKLEVCHWTSVDLETITNLFT